MKKKVLLQPLTYPSKIKKKDIVEKVLLRDAGYPETMIHVDVFYVDGEIDNTIYDKLMDGESVEVWMSFTFGEPHDDVER